DISITERVRFWVLCDGECKMLEQGYGEAWVTSMFQGECAIQFQDYSEAIVVSMLILEFQATGPLGLVLCNRKRTLKLMVSAQGEGQIDLDHHGVALVTSMLTLRIQLKGSCLGVGYSVSGYIERTETLALRKELGSGSYVTGVQDVGTGL
ncbi:putative Hydrolase Pnkd, partial [Manis pentadactyla]